MSPKSCGLSQNIGVSETIWQIGKIDLTFEPKNSIIHENPGKFEVQSGRYVIQLWTLSQNTKLYNSDSRCISPINNLKVITFFRIFIKSFY